MFQLLQKEEISGFYNQVREVRKERHAWNIVELGLVSEGENQYTISQIGDKLAQIFSDRDGAGLICNAHEIIAVIKWGDSRDTAGLCHRVNNNMPEHACYVSAQEASVEGIEKIQIKLMEEPDKADGPTITQKRKNRTHSAILIVTEDTETKFSLNGLFEEYGKITIANTLDKILLKNAEAAPNMIVWDIDTVPAAYEMVFSQDPDAAIVMISAAVDVNAVIEAKKAGVMDFIKKPLDERKVQSLVGSCPHFGWKME